MLPLYKCERCDKRYSPRGARLYIWLKAIYFNAIFETSLCPNCIMEIVDVFNEIGEAPDMLASEIKRILEENNND